MQLKKLLFIAFMLCSSTPWNTYSDTSTEIQQKTREVSLLAKQVQDAIRTLRQEIARLQEQQTKEQEQLQRVKGHKITIEQQISSLETEVQIGRVRIQELEREIQKQQELTTDLIQQQLAAQAKKQTLDQEIAQLRAQIEEVQKST